MKKYHVVGLLTLFLFVASAIFFIFWFPPHQAEITRFTVEHPVLAPVMIILWRIVGVVIPPISGGVLSFALIPVIGWFPSFLYSTVGLLIGASVAFYLARFYREPLVKRFVPLQELQEWEGKLTGTKELWTFVLIRLTTGPVMDFISYLAGLSKLSFRKFFFATLLSLLPSAVSYYAGEAVYAKLADESPYLGIGFFVLLGILFFVYQKKIMSHRKKKLEKKTRASHGI